MFFFGNAHKEPHVQYAVADISGEIIRQVPFNLREPVMMHDFAVTEDYAVFFDLPLFFRPKVSPT